MDNHGQGQSMLTNLVPRSPLVEALTLAEPDVRVLTSFIKWSKALT